MLFFCFFRQDKTFEDITLNFRKLVSIFVNSVDQTIYRFKKQKRHEEERGEENSSVEQIRSELLF